MELIQIVSLANLQIPWIITIVIISIEILNACMAHKLNFLGIVPRTLPGTIGIFFAPLLHTSLKHVIFNSIAFMILSTAIIATFDTKTFVLLLVGSCLLQGILTWVIGRNFVHVGISGCIFAFIGFVIFKGFVDHNQICLVVAALFSITTIKGILPKKDSSFEGHIAGLISGILLALIIF